MLCSVRDLPVMTHNRHRTRLARHPLLSHSLKLFCSQSAPTERGRQNVPRRVVNPEYSPDIRGARGRGAMERQHFKHKDISSLCKTLLYRKIPREPPGHARRNRSQCVATQGNLHRTVIRSTVIEMHPHKVHVLEDRAGRLTVPNTRFFGPVYEIGMLVAFGNSDDPILMPGHAPVDPLRLIEGDHAHGDEPFAEQTHGSPETTVARQGLDDGGVNFNALARRTLEVYRIVKNRELPVGEQPPKPEASSVLKFLKVVSRKHRLNFVLKQASPHTNCAKIPQVSFVRIWPSFSMR